MSGAGRPAYCQTTAMTGMLMSGRMSTGVRIAASGPISTIRTAMTMKVRGRDSAVRTSASIQIPLFPRYSAWIGATGQASE